MGCDIREIENLLADTASSGIRPGLARLALLLYKADMPQNKFPVVHIAGTNGKGSTAAGLYAIFRASGYKTALYTSPHLVSFTERLIIDDVPASPESWRSAVLELKCIIGTDAKLRNDPPTYFELITAAAILILADAECDVVIFEAGMGGRLDASNILKDVKLSLIVPIGMDHTEYLGDTLEKIACEKFAIMRPGVPALFAGDEKLNGLFAEHAQTVHALPHIFTEEYKIASRACTLHGTDFSLNGRHCHTPLIGTFQCENASYSVAAAEILKSQFKNITNETIKEGIAETKWQGRMEVVRHTPLLLLDGGHNAHAARRVAETLHEILGDNKINVIIAMMKDKDIHCALSCFKGLNAQFFCTEVPENARSLKCGDMARMAREAELNVAGSFDSPLDALKAVTNFNPSICCGSLFLVGYMKEHLLEDVQ